MNNSQILPIVFATDKDTVPVLEVALHSLVCNARTPNVTYKVYVLSLGLSAEIAPKLSSHVLINRQVELEFIDIEEIEHLYLIKEDMSSLAKASTLKLLIPELFPQYDQILYLACDLTVAVDVYTFSQFNQAMSEHLVAGVRDLKLIIESAHATHRPADLDQKIINGELVDETSYFGKDYLEKVLQLPSYQFYINTGVLYFNLDRIRKFKLENAFVDSYQKLSANHKLFEHDQDSINFVLAKTGGAYFIERRFNDYYSNFEMASLFEPDIDKAQALIDHNVCIQTFQKYLEEWDQILTFEKFAGIHHFRDNPKPWDTFNLIYVVFWWAATSTMENYADYVVSFHNKYGIIIDHQSLTYINHLGKRFYSTEGLTPYSQADIDRIQNNI